MKGIEGGKLTEHYLEIVEPYRKVLEPFVRKDPRYPHTDIELLFIHDIKHFIKDTVYAHGGKSFEDVFSGDMRLARLNLSTLLTNAGQEIQNVVSPTTEALQLAFNRGVSISPYIRDYIDALFDSMDYLEALAYSNHSEEEEALLALAQRRLRVSPICAYYRSEFLVDGRNSNDIAFDLDGIRFIVYYNLLTNANQHSVPREPSGRLSRSLSTTDFSPAKGTLTVRNFSEYGLTQKPKTEEAFWTDQYGLFIANLYADLAGLELTTNVREDGTYKGEVYGQRGLKDLPRYTISISMN